MYITLKFHICERNLLTSHICETIIEITNQIKQKQSKHKAAATQIFVHAHAGKTQLSFAHEHNSL